MNTSFIKTNVSIDDLPDEVLEFILSLIPPYKDLHDCLSVSKRWRRCAQNVAKTKQRNLYKAIEDFDIAWDTIIPEDMAPTITKRYSHSAVIHENSMYVFGGCTCSMTTFNDLWRLDLSKRQWVRPLTMGTYPSPKACCSMVCYKDMLVLFGGWTHPASYPLYQTWHLFNELHIYDILANKWICINTINSPPPTAGHSVSVHGKWMVAFGGLQRGSNAVHSTKSNDIWKLDMDTWTWYKQETVEVDKAKPFERYGQSQTELDDENLLIMGGTSGTAVYYSDVWILKMKGDLWRWINVEVRNKSAAPPTLWCNPTCKIGNRLIVLSRSRQNTSPPVVYYAKAAWVPRVPIPEKSSKPVDKDENVNGRRGSFGQHRPPENAPGPSRLQQQPVVKAPSEPSSSHRGFVQSRTDHKREKRLEALKRIEEKLKHQTDEPSQFSPPPKKQKTNLLGMYVLDISHVLDETPYVTWLPLKNEGMFTTGPEETVLYTLVSGKSEMIMFGGIQKEGNLLACTTNLSNQVTNSLHFISAPKYVI